MEQQTKQAWSQALRSGLYHQGTGKLQTIENDGDIPKNCCLAILGKVNALEVDEEGIQFKGDISINEVKATSHYPFLEKFGLDDRLQRTFIKMNDEQQLTFDEIADFIDTTNLL